MFFRILQALVSQYRIYSTYSYNFGYKKYSYHDQSNCTFYIASVREIFKHRTIYPRLYQ